MKRLAAGFIGIAITLAPAALAQDRPANKNMDADMQRAIQFQRNKDAADARQAQMERNRPTTSEAGANRSAEPERGRIVTDPGPGRSDQTADRMEMNAGSSARSYRTEPSRQELQRAVTWERFKDNAAARQAQAEGHGSKDK